MFIIRSQSAEGRNRTDTILGLQPSTLPIELLPLMVAERGFEPLPSGYEPDGLDQITTTPQAVMREVGFEPTYLRANPSGLYRSKTSSLASP